MGNLASATWALASNMNRMENKHWNVFARGTDEIGVPKVIRDTDTEHWIIHSVAPTLQKFFASHPDSLAYNAVIEALQKAFAEAA
jgi:hypothetical protein